MRRKPYFLVLLLIIFMIPNISTSQEKKPFSVAEIALYQQSDRQKILEKGARKEGKLTFYTSGTWSVHIVEGFKKKYPYIKVDRWRTGSKGLVSKIIEEYRAGKSKYDIIEGTQSTYMALTKLKILQPYYSPNLVKIENDAITRAPRNGALSVGIRASGIGLGFNTKMLTEDQVPKTYKDLLNPKWKGKMAIVGSSTGVAWLGAMLNAHGEDFVKQVAGQKFDVHMVSGRALHEMIIAREYALSPTIYDSHVINSRKKGAPIAWVPLEPVAVNLGEIGLPKHSANPHAAMLFIDYELSKEGAEIYKSGGYNTMHKDVSPLLKPYRKFYGSKSLKEEKRWSNLFNRLFLLK